MGDGWDLLLKLQSRKPAGDVLRRCEGGPTGIRNMGCGLRPGTVMDAGQEPQSRCGIRGEAWSVVLSEV